MKHFIYTDMDILNSYLSQINDGLVKNIQTSITDEVVTTSDNTTTESSNKFETNIGLKPILSLKFTEDPDIIKTTNTLSQLESGKELIEKLIHDNALQQFVNYLESNDLIKNANDCKIGDYVKFTAEYSLIDFDHILSIYTEEFIDFFAESSVNSNITNSLKKELIKQQKEEQKTVKRIFKIAKNLLPASQFFISNECIIPLNMKFLRESTSSIRFNYTGKITILGKYTSTLEKSVVKDMNVNSNFGFIFSSLDEVSKAFYNENLGIPLSSKVILPIALYFE